jgi:chitinase
MLTSRIDIDWEFPVSGGLASNGYSPDDKLNYVLLMQAIRNAIGYNKLLTFAAGAGPDSLANLDIPGMASVVDFVNVMTYDFRGGWSKFTGHQTPLYPSTADPDPSLTCSATSVQTLLNQGMPGPKINMGAAFYGRGWQGVPNTNNGLFQPFSGVPVGSWDDGTSGATGVFDYKAIKAKIASGQFRRYWDDQVKAPWVYDGSNVMISYDDAQSIAAKCQFVNAMGLGGIMIWELTGDDGHELAGVIAANCNGASGGVIVVPAPSSRSSAVPNVQPTTTSSLTQQQSSSSTMSVVESSTSFVVAPPVPTDVVITSISTSSSTATLSVEPTTSTAIAPPPVTGNTPIMNGVACLNEQPTCASATSFAMCVYSYWIVQPCAPGTACKNLPGGGFLCDWP